MPEAQTRRPYGAGVALAAILGVWLASVPTGAAELPAFDIQAWCAWAGRHQHADLATCLAMNQRSYEHLKFLWPDLSEAMTDRAVGAWYGSRQATTTMPGPNYTILEGYVRAWSAGPGDQAR